MGDGPRRGVEGATVEVLHSCLQQEPHPRSCLQLEPYPRSCLRLEPHPHSCLQLEPHPHLRLDLHPESELRHERLALVAKSLSSHVAKWSVKARLPCGAAAPWRTLCGLTAKRLDGLRVPQPFLPSPGYPQSEPTRK